VVEPRRLLEIENAVDGFKHTLRLTGEVDLSSAELLEDAMRQVCAGRRATELVVDLGGVSFMDSTGLRTLLVGKALCARSGVELRVLPGHARVRRLLEITGLGALTRAAAD
jgi:anti-anti-sigma factor